MSYSGKIHIVYDGMWGSCGKGKFCGTLARDPKLDIKVCVNNNAPNAGHTFVYDNGKKVVTKHIPIGFVNKNIPYLVIGESAVIDIDRLVYEIETYKEILNGRKLFIADTAAVVLPKHKEWEKNNLKSGSTYSGAGAALVDKINRKNNIVALDERCKELERQGLIKIVPSKTFFPMIFNGLGGFKGDENILVELSQGDALSLNNTANYPYTTSRDCTPAQALKDIHATDYSSCVIKYCVFRPYPIRINNIGEPGYRYTGDFDGAKEIDWREVCQRSGCNEEEIKTLEHTTVTKRLRRVSEFSIKQFAEMLLDTRPDVCFLNFAEYVDGGIANLTRRSARRTQNYFVDNSELSDKEYFDVATQNYAIEHILGYIENMEEYFNDLLQENVLRISRIGTGAKEREWIHRNDVRKVSNVRYAIKDINPFDYADKTNLPDFASENFTDFNDEK